MQRIDITTSFQVEGAQETIEMNERVANSYHDVHQAAQGAVNAPSSELVAPPQAPTPYSAPPPTNSAPPPPTQPEKTPDSNDPFAPYLAQVKGIIGSGQSKATPEDLRVIEVMLEQAKELGFNSKALEELTKITKEHRTTLEKTNADGQQGQGGWFQQNRGTLSDIGGDLMGRGLAGAGAFGEIAGSLSRLLGPGGILLGGAVAAYGGLRMVGNFFERQAEPALQEGAAYLDLSRQLNTTKALIYDFKNENFTTQREFTELGYSSRETGQFAAQYGLPSPYVVAETGLERSTELHDVVLEGFKLARYTGTDTSQVANLMQLGGMTGAMDRMDPGTFISTLYMAVKDGTLYGVSNAETLQGIKGLMERANARGSNLAPADLAAYSSMVTAAESRHTPNASGAVGKMLEGFGNLSGPDKVMAYNALNMNDPEKRLKGEDVFSDKNEISLYNAYLKEGALDMALDMLLTEAQDSNPVVLQKLLPGIDQQLGGSVTQEGRFFERLGLTESEFAGLRGGDHGSAFEMANYIQPGDLNRYTGAAPEDIDVDRNRDLVNLGYRQEELSVARADAESIRALAASTIDLNTAFRGFEEGIYGMLQEMGQATSNFWRMTRGEDPIDYSPTPEQKKQWEDWTEFGGYGNPYNPYTPPELNEANPSNSSTSVFDNLENYADIQAALGGSAITNLPGTTDDAGHAHAGLDVTIGQRGVGGDPFKAPFGGTIKSVGYDEDYGNYLEADFGKGVTAKFGHFQEPVEYHEGQAFGKGDVLGFEGMTGKATGPHVHMDFDAPEQWGDVDKNPTDYGKLFKYLNGEPTQKEPEGSTGKQDTVVVRFEGEGVRVFGDHPFAQHLQSGLDQAMTTFRQNPNDVPRRG